MLGAIATLLLVIVRLLKKLPGFAPKVVNITIKASLKIHTRLSGMSAHKFPIELGWTGFNKAQNIQRLSMALGESPAEGASSDRLS
jgi:hypothetical protein